MEKSAVRVLVLAVMPVVAYLICSGYQETIRDAETTTRNDAAILDARLAGLRVADRYGDMGPGNPRARGFIAQASKIWREGVS